MLIKSILISACVVVSCSIARGSVVTGSGYAIGENYILTAAHVVKDAEQVVTQFDQCNIHTAEVVKIDKIDDWAVLKTQRKIEHYGCVSRTPACLGDKVYVLGYPSSMLLGENVKYTEGVVSSTTGIQGTKGNFQLSAPVQPGNSGGPIFSENGVLVGIVLSSLDAELFKQTTGGALPQNVNFGLHCGYIYDRIKDYAHFAESACKVSLKDNQMATCFIRAHLKSISKPDNSVSRVNENEKIRSAKRWFDVGDWAGHYSPRFYSIIDSLKNFAAHRFEMPDGTMLTPSLESDFDNLFLVLQKGEAVLKAEVEVNAKLSGEVNTLKDRMRVFDICFLAYNSIVDEHDRNRVARSNILSNQKFWGARLGDCCELRKERGEPQIFNPREYTWNYTIEVSGSRYEQLSCTKMSDFSHVSKYGATLIGDKQFCGSSDITLYLTDANKLVGVEFEKTVSEDRNADVEYIKNLFERRYSIRFKRVPNEYEPLGTELHSRKSGSPLKIFLQTAYVYSDGQISILICPATPYPVRVTVSYANFQKAIMDDYVGNVEKARSVKRIQQSDLDAL